MEIVRKRGFEMDFRHSRRNLHHAEFKQCHRSQTYQNSCIVKILRIVKFARAIKDYQVTLNA